MTTTIRTITTRAKTPAGIARAYIRQYGMPRPDEWSAGGRYGKRDLVALKDEDGLYRLRAVSVFAGRPAGVIYGPRFAVAHGTAARDDA